MCNAPVLNGIERVLVGNVIHKQEAHCSSVVGCGNGAVSLLSRCVLQKKQKKKPHALILCYVLFTLDLVGSTKQY